MAIAVQNHLKKHQNMIVHQLESRYFKEYVYRGEGNSNLVVSLPPTRSVLRFRKNKYTKELADGKTRISFEWKFFSKYIAKYMEKFVTAPEIIKCHPRDFDNWNEKVEIFRSGHRKHKNIYEEYAIKLPDYAQLPQHLVDNDETGKSTFCIEIKPKQGFIPESDRRMQCCPYCMKQFYKVAKKRISKRSNYCPCDLFSGDRKRLYRAINALIDSPQNNFVIFKNGNVVWGEGHSEDALKETLGEWFSGQMPQDNLCHLLCETLLREFPNRRHEQMTRNCNEQSENHVTVSYTTSERFTPFCQSCDFPNGNLPEGSVLGHLFRMQQLHSTSAEDVYKVYSKHLARLDEETVYFAEPHENKYKNSSINFCDILILRNYLLFSIARDCSILLAFQKINNADQMLNCPEEHVVTILEDYQTFVFNIGITDLDPKALNRIEKHHQRTMDSIRAAQKNDKNIDSTSL